MASASSLPNGLTQQSAPIDPATIRRVVEQLRSLHTTIAAGEHPRFKKPEQPQRVLPSEPHGGHPFVSTWSSTNAGATASKSTAIPPLENVAFLQAPVEPKNTMKEPDPKLTLQERRQRLEHVLEKQLQEKRMLYRQRPCDAEVIADFDISEILRRAHELVKPWKPNDIHSTNESRASSDSFDDNTFYSSQMNESSTTEEVDKQPNLQHPDRPCNFFQSGKPCPYGEKCIYSHDPAIVQNGAKKQNRPAARAKEQERRPPAKSPARKSAPSGPAPPAAPAADRNASKIAKLEEELRRLKDPGPKKPTVVARAVERPDPEPLNNGSVDEFGRDKSRREQYREEPKDTVRLFTLSFCHPHISSLTQILSTQQPVQVVRNHITSPYAPQPARVSPLTGVNPPQLPQVQRNVSNSGPTSKDANGRGTGARQSPAVAGQFKNGKRRRDPIPPEEDTRNVVPRHARDVSPVIRIKEEPVSPPPLSHSIPQIRYGSDSQASPRFREQSIQDDDDGEYIFHPPVQEPRPITPSQKRVVSNGHRFPAEKSNLRKVVSTRNLQAPTSPVYEVQHPDARHRVMRTTSNVQYVSEQAPPMQYRASAHPQMREHPQYITEQPIPPQYRASVHPEVREYIPQPIELTTERRASLAMAPPTRRIVVDQFGNRYMEAPVQSEQPVHYPVTRQVALDPQYEQLSPSGGHVIRRTQPQQMVYEDNGQQYIQHTSPPESPQYIEYPTAANSSVRRRHQIIRLDDDYEEQPAPPKLVRYENQPRTVVHYNDPNIDTGSDDSSHQVRVQRIQRLPDPPHQQQYEPLPPPTPREQASRVGSVRPQPPRIVRLGEQEENPRLIRQMSMSRPDDAESFVSRVQRVPPPPEEGQHPAAQGGYQRAYVEQGQFDGGRNGQRMGSRVIRLE